MKAPDITPATIDACVALLDSWNGKLTWDILTRALQREVGHRYTKAALDRHPKIKLAWVEAKSRKRLGKAKHGDVAIELALSRQNQLEAEISRLKAENNLLLEQFIRWSYNAARQGLEEKYLNQPILIESKR